MNANKFISFGCIAALFGEAMANIDRPATAPEHQSVHVPEKFGSPTMIVASPPWMSATGSMAMSSPELEQNPWNTNWDW